MDNPYFTVVIPVYNRASELRTALQSVLDQTYQDFEIVVVDDGSVDDPKSVVADFGDTRVHFVRQKNAGGGAARNTGIDLARGCFLAFLDSDDSFLPHHLASMYALLKESRLVAAYSRVLVDRGEGLTFMKPPRGIGPDEDMACYLLCDRGFTATSTIVVPTDAARLVRFNENLRAAEDTDFAIRLCNAGLRFQMLDQPGAVWNDRDDPQRASADDKHEPIRKWLDELRPALPPKAYHGARGWPYAKRVVRQRPLAALFLYLNALVRGCYRPSLAGVVFLQIFLGSGSYRRFANRLLSLVRRGPRADKVKSFFAKAAGVKV